MIKKLFSVILFGAMILSLCACGTEQASSTNGSEKEQSVSVQNVESQREETESQMGSTEAEDDSIELETPLLAWEDDMIKVEIVGFFQEVDYWDENPTTESGVTFKYTNKADAEFQVWLTDAYIGTDSVSMIRTGGDDTVAPGKSAISNYIFQKYAGSKEVALDSMQELYDLEGKLKVFAFDDNIDSYDFSFSIPELMSGGGPAAKQAAMAQMLEEYGDVLELLEQDIWYFNGGSDTILNGISFSKEKATISQVYFDGNGKHENGSNDCDYVIDGENITVTLSDGSELVISYTVNGDAVTLGSNEYFTPSEVDAAIQGYWSVSTSYMGSGTQKYIFFNNGAVTSEKATESLADADGTYFYYGPYEGTYTLNFGGLETDMSHGGEWFFNIIDGAVVLLNYDNVCYPASGFPGENGYSF